MLQIVQRVLVALISADASFPTLTFVAAAVGHLEFMLSTLLIT